MLHSNDLISGKTSGGIELLTIENDHLRVVIAPAGGGKIVSCFNKALQKEFLWTNKNVQLSVHNTGADYDSNFTGGIDELIPNDVPETIDSIDYPDHGELWTTSLSFTHSETEIRVEGLLALSSLFYSKTIRLDNDAPVVHLAYNIRNDSGKRRHFLWKLHAAVNIEAGDRLVTPANYGQVVDPEYSRFKRDLNSFHWPVIENTDASIIPEKNNSVDFFYLHDIPKGEMQLHLSGEQLFGYTYDNKIFPYQWWFASYGGFLDHYTAILEPCTNMPMSVNEAKEKGQSAMLEPGESLITAVQIFAGTKELYSSHE